MKKLFLKLLGRDWLAQELGVSSQRLTLAEQKFVDDIDRAVSEALRAVSEILRFPTPGRLSATVGATQHKPQSGYRFAAID